MNTNNNFNNNKKIEKHDKLTFTFRIKPENKELVKYEEKITITVGNEEFIENFDNELINKIVDDKNRIIVENFWLPSSSKYFPNEIATIGIKIHEHVKHANSNETIKNNNSNQTNLNNENNFNNNAFNNNQSIDEFLKNDKKNAEKQNNHHFENNNQNSANKNKSVNNDDHLNQTNNANNNNNIDNEKNNIELLFLKEQNKKLMEKIEKLENEKMKSIESFKEKAQQVSEKAQQEIIKLKNQIKDKAKEEIEENKKYILQKFAEELLSPLNNLYLSVEFGSNQSDPTISGYVKGFQLLVSQIFEILEKHGIKIIEPKQNDEYNPEYHYAQEVIQDNNFSKDKIIKIISRGYMLNNRVLKPAIVIVAK